MKKTIFCLAKRNRLKFRKMIKLSTVFCFIYTPIKVFQKEGQMATAAHRGHAAILKVAAIYNNFC